MKQCKEEGAQEQAAQVTQELPSPLSWRRALCLLSLFRLLVPAGCLWEITFSSRAALLKARAGLGLHPAHLHVHTETHPIPSLASWQPSIPVQPASGSAS